jgi:hypothetical protein
MRQTQTRCCLKTQPDGCTFAVASAVERSIGATVQSRVKETASDQDTGYNRVDAWLEAARSHLRHVQTELRHTQTQRECTQMQDLQTVKHEAACNVHNKPRIPWAAPNRHHQ